MGKHIDEELNEVATECKGELSEETIANQRVRKLINEAKLPFLRCEHFHYNYSDKNNWLEIQLTSKDIGREEGERVKELLGLNKEYITTHPHHPPEYAEFSGFWRCCLPHAQDLKREPTGHRGTDESMAKWAEEALEATEELERLFTKNLPHLQELARKLETGFQRLVTDRRGAAGAEKGEVVRQ